MKPLNPSQITFGFISVREIESVGYCGGLLIVSQLGRPLEFHCSAPVVANRAQQILYGKTYRSFLFCEQIGLSLIEKTKGIPQLIIANTSSLAPLSELIEPPLVVLKNREGDPEEEFNTSPGTLFSLDDFDFWYAAKGGMVQRPDHQQPFIRNLLNSFTKSLTLDEPFERIEKAIEEAQAVAR